MPARTRFIAHRSRTQPGELQSRCRKFTATQPDDLRCLIGGLDVHSTAPYRFREWLIRTRSWSRRHSPGLGDGPQI